MRDYFQSPVDKSWVNFNGHPNGDAMDLGWRSEWNNKNQPVYMPADGTVIENAYYSDGGNSLITKHDYNDQYDAWVGMMHFKDKAYGSPGEFIKRGKKIANMGATGKSFGEHVHIRLSLVPKGTPFSWAKFNQYRVNPYDYFFEFSHQDVLDLKKKPSKPFKPAKSKEVKEDGEITVTVDVGLRVRQSPSLSAKQTGLLPKGTKKVYTHYVDADGIRWVKLKEGGYAARRTLDNKTIYADARFLNEKPAPKPIVKGSKVRTTAKKDIFGTNLDPHTVNANRTFTVEQVGRNGNANHVLLKEIMTWVEKTTLKVV